jgi:uncharacterized protein (UPF0276 family)
MRVHHLGHGVGLRHQHFERIESGKARADWFEIISENFMIPGGRPLKVLELARAIAPVVFHGTSMNLGGTDPLNETYLNNLAELIRRYEPAWISDHLCWTAFAGDYSHDLLPLPFTDEALRNCAQRIRRVQQRLGRRILIENISSYLTFKHSEMPEWAFLGAVADMADCGILLDLNNLYVNSVNHRFDADEYLQGLPRHRVKQIHLAGHSSTGHLLIDTHDHPVPLPVWDLFHKALSSFGGTPTLIEWDDRVPPFETLLMEANKARKIETEELYDRTAAA